MSALRLVPAAGPAHAALWFGWRQEPSTRRYNPLDPHDEAQLLARLAAGSSDLADESHSEFRWMVERDDAAVIGIVSLKGVSWRMGYGELSYGLGAEYHGRGYGTASARLLVDHIFATSRLRRVWAGIAADNTASRRIVERLGFTQEGILRRHFLIEGRPTDEVVYGLLREEWPGASPT